MNKSDSPLPKLLGIQTKWAGISILLLVGFALRLAVFSIFPTIPIKFDQSGYLREALDLLHSGILVWDFDKRAPGYIFFLAANYKAAAQANHFFVRALQSLLGTVSIALVFAITQLAFYRLPRRVFTGAALIAGGILAFYPDLIFFANTLWPETFFVFLTLLGGYLLLRGARARSGLVYLSISGVVFGMASLTRELVLPFALLVIPLWLWWVTPSNQRFRILRALVFLFPCVLLILSWTFRNYAQGRGLELISSQGSHDFWVDNTLALNPSLTETQVRQFANRSSKNLTLARQAVLLVQINRKPLQWLVAKLAIASELAWDARSNLMLYGVSLKLITRAEASSFELWLELVWYGVIGFTLVGFASRCETNIKLLFLGYLVTSLAVFFLTDYIPRYRLDLMPLLLPFTGLGLMETARVILHARRRAPKMSFN